MAEFASKGVAGAGLGLGIAGTALSLLNGGLGTLLSGGRTAPANGNSGTTDNCSCHKSNGVDPSVVALMASVLGAADRGGSMHYCNEIIGATRYDLGIMQQLAAKDAEIAKLSLSQEIDTKILALYQFIDAQNKATGQEIAKLAAGQAVVNQQINDNLVFMQNDLNNKINLEAERRCCGDNSIVTYLNTNFQPKAIASFTPSTDAPTIASTFNPIANCGCSCGCGR